MSKDQRIVDPVDEQVEKLAKDILDAAIKVGSQLGISLSAVSNKVAGDGKFLPGLQGKKAEDLNFTIGKYRQVMKKLNKLIEGPTDNEE